MPLCTNLWAIPNSKTLVKKFTPLFWGVNIIGKAERPTQAER